MKLIDLIKDVEHAEVIGDASVKIKNIVYDSSKAEKDDCFVAIRGEKVDGHQFIKEAIRNGAKAVVSDSVVKNIYGATNVVVSDTRLALARMSSNLFKNPSSKMRIIGVTGTNGKTTITYILESVLKLFGRETGVIGTVNWRYKDVKLNAPNTTPMSYDLQKLLGLMNKAHVQDVLMEVSSHALDQRRVEAVEFDGAIFTNLSHDHMDYHKDFEDYFRAKGLLFSEFLPASSKKTRVAVTNAIDPYGKKILAAAKRHKDITTVTFGLNNDADVFASDLKMSVEGNKMKVFSPWGEMDCFSRLGGEFNAFNVVASVALLGAFGIPLKIIKEGIESLRFVPGRLEKLESGKGFSIFVDYAHTPDALKNVARVLKGMTPRRLIVVFGCGGDRDRTKRSLMGEIAAHLGDVVIVTSDNPRSEDPLVIIDEILKGIKKEGKKALVEEDREKAIGRAIEMAEEGDTVLIAGKGHETYQIVGKEVRHFDDKEEVTRHLNYGIKD